VPAFEYTVDTTIKGHLVLFIDGSDDSIELGDVDLPVKVKIAPIVTDPDTEIEAELRAELGLADDEVADAEERAEESDADAQEARRERDYAEQQVDQSYFGEGYGGK